MAKNKEVEAWFARYENPMKPVVERIRAIVLAADARMQHPLLTGGGPKPHRNP